MEPLMCSSSWSESRLAANSSNWPRRVPLEPLYLRTPAPWFVALEAVGRSPCK